MSTRYDPGVDSTSSIHTRETVLAKKPRLSGRKTAKKKAVKKRRTKVKWPSAFRVVPIRLKTKLTKHAHVMGQEGIPPCPPGTTYQGKVQVNGVTYCMYIDENGGITLIRC